MTAPAIPAASRSNLFSASLRTSPAVFFLAAAMTASLNADLPSKPANAPPAPTKGPPVAVPTRKPTPAVKTDSIMFGPCWAKLATNQSTTPRLGSEPMSVNWRWKGEVLRKSSACCSTMRPPSSSAPANCKPRPTSICKLSIPMPKFLDARRPMLGLRMDCRYCW